MTLTETMKKLKALGDEKRREHNRKAGAGENQFGVAMGDIRALAKKIKVDHALALSLWKTGNIDAQSLAILLMKPKELTADELDALVRSVTYAWVADWLNNYIVKQHPEKEALRLRWMADANPMAARSGWSLTEERIAKSPDGLNVGAVLDRIEAEMGKAHPHTQWTMNFALIAIGVHHAALRTRAVAVGETLGVYREYPCSKGCVSPFAATAIPEMVKRAKAK